MHALFDERRYLIPFRSTLLPHIFTDTLVIGAGAAGLSAAIAAATHGDVIVLGKSRHDLSNTAWAQGGIAAVSPASDDSPEAHTRDTLAAGAGLCDATAVRQIVSRGPEAIERILAWGFQADRDPTAPEVPGRSRLALGREGGHSARRIVHAFGDATGAELERCLLEKCRATTGLRLFENCFAIDLITPTSADGAPCMGAITWHQRYGLQIIWARATILATGGAGVVWRETSNPPIATGDGLAMAYRAGAALADLAFMQFHPTALYVAGAPRKLISEAVRGEGAFIVDDAGRRFLLEDPAAGGRAELAPRDIVSRAIHRQLARSGAPHVWLDCRHLVGFAARFPAIAATLAQFDLDPARDLIPVNPAAHYFVGGIRTDLLGRTSVPALYAVGEAASTGLHGANRLASNSLLEALVLGYDCGRVCEEMKTAPGDSAPRNAWGVALRSGPARVISDIPLSDHAEIDLADVRSSLRSAMWRNVGIERTGARLDDAAEMFDFWARYTLDKIFDDPAGWETQNMLVIAALVARSSAWRTESRGCHFRSDFPEPDPRLAVHDVWRRGRAEPDLLPVTANNS